MNVLQNMPITGFQNHESAESLASMVAYSQKPKLSPRPATNAPPIAMLGLPFDNVTLREALARITAMIESRRPHYVVTANVDFTAQARNDSELRSIFLDAHLVIGDGMPLVWASRLLGNPLPERVAGADLVPKLICLAAERGYRLFFLGASDEANQKAIANTRAKYPGISIAGHYSPPFAPLAEMNNAEIIRRIREAKPDILLVAFGCPKQEKWMARHYRTLGVPVMMGVGATIDFLAGRVKRAPVWMQRTGLEWSFRLAQEPKRLMGRYMNDFWCFGRGLTKQWWCATRWKLGHNRGPLYCVVTTSSTWKRIQIPQRLDCETVKSNEWIWQRAGQSNCVVDLSQTRFMDSTGVGLLLRLRKELRQTGRDLLLLSPRSQVVGLLKSIRLYDHFSTIEDMHEILQAPQPEVRKIAPVRTVRRNLGLRRRPMRISPATTFGETPSYPDLNSIPA